MKSWLLALSDRLVLNARDEQVNLLYDSLRVAVVGTLLVNFGLYQALSSVVPAPRLVAWVGLSTALALVRGWMALTYRRRPRTQRDP